MNAQATPAPAPAPSPVPAEQPEPAAKPRPTPRTRRAAPAVRQRAPQNAPGIDEPAAEPGAPAPAPGSETTTTVGSDIKPFETGIDYQPTPPNTRVTFNLEDADLPELVRMMSQITGRSFILPSKARSIKATVYAPTKVSAAEAYQAFLSILELNGMALVPSGRYMKIVESGRVEGRAVPLFTNEETVPTGDRFLTRLQSVKNIAAEDASQLLERFKSGDGSLTAYAPTNMLIMTDTGTNIRRMLRILEVVDVARTGEQIWIEPVHHANATDLATRLGELFDVGKQAADKKDKKPQAPGTATIGGSDARLTKILADERTNSLIIVATEAAYLRILETLKQLDSSMEGEGRIHVHHLQHSSADEIATTLTNLIGKGGDKKESGSVFEGKVAVTAHKPSNALVVTSSAHDFSALRGVINMLDSERKQVFIEAVIMELSVKRGSNYGLGYHGGIPNSPTDNAISVIGFNAQRTIGGLVSAGNADFLTGLAVGVQGPDISDSGIGFSIPGFGVALHALASSGEANVLSTPHLIASDNVEAEISVGENVPLQTSSVGGLGSSPLTSLLGGAAGAQGAGAAALLGGLGGLGGFGGSVPRQDVGTTVTITPHLNDANEIRLEIAEEISAAGPPEQTGNLGVRSISRTKAKTEVVVRDQHTVVIGGLMRDEMTNGSTKVPILGDIPLLGALFRTTEKTKVKKNLLLFLTPYIIRSPADLRSIYERKMRERQEFVDRYFVFSDTDYEAPVDYSRTRGLLGEMFKEIATLSAERKIASEEAFRTEPTHEPRSPVGLAPISRREGDGAGAANGTNAAPGAAAPAPGAENAPVLPPAEVSNAAPPPFAPPPQPPPAAAPPTE